MRRYFPVYAVALCLVLMVMFVKTSVFLHRSRKTCPVYFQEEVMKSLFRLWIDLSKRLKVNYTLWYGSLLGQTRNNSYIPYDSDIDVLMDIKYVRRFFEYLTPRGPKYRWSGKWATLMIQPDFYLPPHARRLFNCKSNIVTEDLDPCSFRLPCLRLFFDQFHIDIFCTIMGLERIKDPEYEIFYYRKSILPFRECQYLGLKTWCAHDPNATLSLYYGNFLKPDKTCKDNEWINNE